MAKKKVKESKACEPCSPMRMPPTASFDLEDGIPEDLPSVNKPIKLIVQGTLVAARGKEYPSDLDNIRVKLGKVTIDKGK